MRILKSLSIVLLFSCASAQQIPWGRPNVPVSTRDRVYAADQTSNTVSVIDPFNNKLLGGDSARRSSTRGAQPAL